MQEGGSRHRDGEGIAMQGDPTPPRAVHGAFPRLSFESIKQLNVD